VWRGRSGVVFGEFGEVEVFFGDAACVVCGECEGDFVVADEDVGVVLDLFGVLCDGVDEGDGGLEVFELERALDGVVEFGPVGLFFEGC